MITHIKPLKHFIDNTYKPALKVFLAGSIDMGQAVEWQEQIYQLLSEQKLDFDIVLFNPRRDDWDSTWEQSIHNTKFREQVTWELQNIEAADLVVFFFDPNGKAPITLLELGIVAGLGKAAVVCCPRGFWRKGNVDIVCNRFNLPVVSSIKEIADFIVRCG